MKEKSRISIQACRKGIFRPAYPYSFLARWAGLFLLVLLAAACDKPVQEALSTTAQPDLFPRKTIIRYAQGFRLSYHGNYKLVSILDHFGKSADTLHYVLVQRGTPPPRHYPQAQVIEIPVRRLVGMSSMHVGLADFVEAADVLMGLGNLKYVSSARVRQNIAAGKVQEVGSGGQLNEELLLALQPDVVMVTGSPEATFSRYQTLTGAGVPVLLNTEWLETTPLGRAEWVKLLAALLNQEALVNEKFARVEREYHRLAALTRKVRHQPRIITGLPYKGSWAVPDGDSYMAAFLRDAGASYHWSQVRGKGSLQLNFESVAPIALQADVWLHPGSVHHKADIAASDLRYQDFRPYQRGAIFNNNKRVNDLGANDYWESGAVNPHLILADLICILHPELLPRHQLVYYKPIY